MCAMTLANRNALPNTYVPVLLKKILMGILGRLPAASLVQLAMLWPKLVHTQPPVAAGSNQRATSRQILDEVQQKFARTIRDEGAGEDASEGVTASAPPKRKLIEKILYEYWTGGLNLLQISQVDCQLIVDRPNAYYWVLSTARDCGGAGAEAPIVLAPQQFLDALAADLSALFMTYIYVCRHPTHPLVIVRVQVFDLQPKGGGGDVSRPHILSHKPFFLAVPMNSPHIIHSPGQSLVAKIVLQCVERCLPQDATNVLKLVALEAKPVRSLELMHILRGSSRFGSSLGAWTPYADGLVDSAPLDSTQDHVLLGRKPPAVPTDAMARLRQLANLRFKGSVDGKVQSERLYDDVRPAKRKRARSNEDTPVSEFASIAPIQYAEFVLADAIGASEEPARIKLKLSGSDVYGGLHELAVQTTDPEQTVVDVRTVPGWLTGEEGDASGVVTQGRLQRAL